MCDHCLEILSGNPIKPTFRLRLISLGFKLKIKYRVFRYTTSKKYAEKWEAEHFKPLLDKAGQEEPYPWWDTEEKGRP